MATDRRVVNGGVTAPGGGDGGVTDVNRRQLSISVVFCCVVAAVLLLAWFFIAWLALDRHALDAAGESVGSAFLLLVLASVVGAVRRGRS